MAARSTYFLLALMMATRGRRICSSEKVLFFGKLDCSNTSRTSFFNPPVNTTYLDMGENRIQRLRKDFLKSSQLLVLRLQNNQVNLIERDAFRLLTNLQVLHLTNNRIRTLDKHTFKLNTHLGWLDLGGNQIVLTESFLISLSIRRLDLRMNKLADIPEYTFSQLRSVTYLSLSSNNLETMNGKSFNDLEKVKYLSLKENSFICDCHLVELWKWANAKVPIDEHISCKSPSDVKGKTWAIVRDLDCKNEPSEPSTYLLIGIISILLIISLILVSFAVRFLKRRRARKRAVPVPKAVLRKTTPVPVGEYIEILPEKGPQQNHYETVNSIHEERSASQPHQNQYETVNSVHEDINRGSYLIPVQKDNEEPIYVNIRGPKLPERSYDKDKSLSQPVPPAPPAPLRRFSIPILDGCDFLEVVD